KSSTTVSRIFLRPLSGRTSAISSIKLSSSKNEGGGLRDIRPLLNAQLLYQYSLFIAAGHHLFAPSIVLRHMAIVTYRHRATFQRFFQPCRSTATQRILLIFKTSKRLIHLTAAAVLNGLLQPPAG